MAVEDLDRNFGFLLHDVARLLRTTFDRRVKGMELTRSQWWVLTHLFRRDGFTQTELAEQLEIEPPSMVKLLDRLETNGWVERRQCSEDRRAKRIFLRAESMSEMREMRQLAADLRGEALAGLSKQDQSKLADILIHIKSNLVALDDGGTRRNGLAKQEVRDTTHG